MGQIDSVERVLLNATNGFLTMSSGFSYKTQLPLSITRVQVARWTKSLIASLDL